MELKYILEAILFTSQQPLSPKELRDLLAGAVEHADEGETATVKSFKKTSPEEISAALEQLAHVLEERS